MKLIRLWRGWRSREAELDEELQSHLRMALRERAERGENPRAAEFAARREFGSVALIEDATRDHWRLFSLESRTTGPQRRSPHRRRLNRRVPLLICATRGLHASGPNSNLPQITLCKEHVTHHFIRFAWICQRPPKRDN